MSLHADNGAGAHLTISAPSAAALGTGDYTIAALVKPNSFTYPGRVAMAYQSDNFSHRDLYVDTDVWVSGKQCVVSIPSIGNPPEWYWFVGASVASTTPEGYYAVYTDTGTLTWVHATSASNDTPGTAINRICLGDEFGSEYRGDIACLATFATKLTPAEVASIFLRSSAAILAASPTFFAHWPQAVGIGSPFSDIAGGGVETIRSGTWSASADPTNFDFSLAPARTGKPKVWDGASWPNHQAKVWDGSSWIAHPANGYDGTSFVLAK